MKIILQRKSYFTFRGKRSDELDLLGKTVCELMRERLDAPVLDEEAQIAFEEDYAVLYPAYPFLTKDALWDYLDGREGSYRFPGGYVVRRGCPISDSPRLGRKGLGLALFSLSDLPKILSEAAAESARLHLQAGALVESGAVVSYLTRLSRGVVVESGARLLGKCMIGENAEIGHGSTLIDSKIGAGTTVKCSYVERAEVGENCTLGPNAYLRPETVVGDGCRIGDFVELKRAKIGNFCKISHLAYVGDAVLGEKTNVGCGAVFVNYDGKKKSRTVVGKGCFIGSNCNLIAPLQLGDGAFVAAGSTLTQNLEKEDFCIARSREVVKPKRGKQYYDPE